MSGRNDSFDSIRDGSIVDGGTEKTEEAHMEKQLPELAVSSPHPVQLPPPPETSTSPARAISTVIVLA